MTWFLDGQRHQRNNKLRLEKREMICLKSSLVKRLVQVVEMESLDAAENVLMSFREQSSSSYEHPLIQIHYLIVIYFIFISV